MSTNDLFLIRENRPNLTSTIRTSCGDLLLSQKNNLYRRKLIDFSFRVICILSVMIAISVLAVLLVSVASEGWQWLSWKFITSFPSRHVELSGIKSGIYGSIMVIVVTMITAIPIGVGSAIYIQELMKESKLRSFIKANISNLAGIPSIIYGILGLAIFVRILGLERSVLAGALALSLVILPIIIIATSEALSAIPNSIRNAAIALGATKWQMVRDHILPNAWAEILTGVILATSRAFGETAPLLIVGALSYAAFIPEGIFDYFTTLPIQIFNWTGRPQSEFHELAAAGIMVLLGILLVTNSFAILLRNKFRRKMT